MQKYPPKRGKYGLDKILTRARELGWDSNSQLVRRDGYEIYMWAEGYTLSMRDPEDLTNEVKLEVSADISNPAYHASVIYILENVEDIVREIHNDK